MLRFNLVDFYILSDMIVLLYDIIFLVYVLKLIGCIRGYVILDYVLFVLVYIF